MRLLKRLSFPALLLWPAFVMIFAASYCAIQGSFHCKLPQHESPEQRAGTSYADSVLNLILAPTISNRTDKKAEPQSECNVVCGLLKKTAADATAFFTLVLCYVVYLQFIWLTRQENVLKESILVATNTADAAKKSADASLLSLRPWLTCRVEIADGLTYTEEGDARFKFVFEIKNVGHSPAMAIRFNPFLTLLSPKHEQAIIRLQRMAEINRGLLPRIPTIFFPGHVTIEGADLGLVLFPGETHTIKYALRIKRDEIVKSCEDTKPSMNFWPILGGLVEYSHPLASVRADTAFVYDVEFSDELFFKLDEVIPMESLSLSRTDREGFAT